MRLKRRVIDEKVSFKESSTILLLMNHKNRVQSRKTEALVSILLNKGIINAKEADEILQDTDGDE